MNDILNNPYIGKEAKLFLKYGKEEEHKNIILNFVDYFKKLELWENLENKYIINDDYDKSKLILEEMKNVSFFLNIFIKDNTN